jgi:hypothetical protein
LRSHGSQTSFRVGPIRSDTDESARRDYTLYIDEFQNFASLAFAKILNEARKWHLSIVLAHQFIAQISESGLMRPNLSGKWAIPGIDREDYAENEEVAA